MKKVKLNEQGTPNISSEITLSFENGSESHSAMLQGIDGIISGTYSFEFLDVIPNHN